MAGAWVCLLLLGWALAGSWLGHTWTPHCEGCVCHAHAEDASGVELSATSVEEREGCLACHLLRCLETASAAAAGTVPVLPVQEALLPGGALVASVPACITGSARSPPMV